MAYIASDPKSKECYAISSADPECATSLAEDLRAWAKHGAIIELLPANEAKGRFCNSKYLKRSGRQLVLFK
jgi:hypothetical protein